MRPRPTRSRGVFLIETVAAVSLTSVLLGLVVFAIHALIRIESAGRARLAAGRSCSRLVRDFREDVRGSLGVSLEAGVLRLRPMGSREGSIVYEPGPGMLVRRNGEDERPDKRSGHVLPSGMNCRFDLEEADGRTVVSLILTDSTPAESGRGGRDQRHEAILGRHGGFVRAEGGTP